MSLERNENIKNTLLLRSNIYLGCVLLNRKNTGVFYNITDSNANRPSSNYFNLNNNNMGNISNNAQTIKINLFKTEKLKKNTQLFDGLEGDDGKASLMEDEK